jgi:hypothetical protein
MFKIITSLTLFAIGLLAQAQSVQTRNVQPFSKIEISSGVEVIITQGAQASLKVTSDAGQELKDIVTEFRNNALYIAQTNDDDQVGKVYVTTPTLTDIKATGGSKVRLTGTLESSAVSVSMASGSTFWGNIHTENLQLAARSGAIVNLRTDAGILSGSFKTDAKVNLSGHATQSELRTQSGALCNARNFAADNSVVTAIDDSSMLVNTKGEISVNVADTAKITYYGKPGKVALNPEAVEVYRTTGSRLLTEK